MTVVGVTSVTVKPDRYEEYLELVRKAKTILEEYGARNCRLLAAVVAGEATGSLAFTFEADDLASWGAMGDKFMADPDAASMMSTGTASPVASQQISGWMDIPL